MDPKKIIPIVALSGIMIGCGTKKGTNESNSLGTDSIKTDTSKHIKDILSKKHRNHTVEYNTTNEAIDTFDIQALIKEKDPAISIADGKNLLWMLGELDANEIIKKYNSHIANTRPENYNWAWHDIRSIDTILNIPHIFPSMKNFFLHSLDSFLIDKPEISEQVNGDQTIIIVTELPNGKFGLGYYESGELVLAYPVSIGDGKWHKDRKTHKRYQGRSPQGRYWIKRKQPRKKSVAHDSMAYFLELIGERGLGLHGQKTQSKLQSHGCFRQPQFAAKMLSERVIADSTDGTPFVSYRQPRKIELDSATYYTKIHPELKKEWLAKQDSIKALTQKDTIQILQKKKDTGKSKSKEIIQ